MSCARWTRGEEQNLGRPPASPVENLETRRERRALARAPLGDDHGAWRQPTLAQPGQGRLQESLSIRGVEKHQIEGFARRGPGGRGLPAEHARLRGETKRLEVSRDCRGGLGGAVEEDTEGGAAGQALETQGAGAGEEVRHARLGERRRPGGVVENIEDRLASAVGGRAGRMCPRRHNQAPSMLAGDDPHCQGPAGPSALKDNRGVGQSGRAFERAKRLGRTGGLRPAR